MRPVSALQGSRRLEEALSGRNLFGRETVPFALMGILDGRRGSLRHSAYLIGIALRAVELAAARSRERRQFNVPISNFQAVTFPLAEHSVRILGLKLRAYQLAAGLDQGHGTTAGIEAFSRLVTQATFATVGHAVHVHGASGLTDAEAISTCYALMLKTSPGTTRSAGSDTASQPPDMAAYLREAQQRRVPSGWAGGTVDYPGPRCVHQLVTEAARRFPDAIAVKMADEEPISYRELDARANRLAHVLRGRGVKADSLVAICLTRCTDMIVTLLGVLKAGGAYLPLDPQYPPDRLGFMIDDSQAAIVITQQWFTEWLPESSASVLTIDTEEQLFTEPTETLPEVAGERNLAYVIYTSGSTGTPKGVEIEHRGLVNRLAWDRATFPLQPGDAILQHTSLSFDIAVMEIFGALVNGATVVLAPMGAERDTAMLARTICEENITALPLVPSVLDVLLEEQPGLAQASNLRYVFSGGEALSRDLCHRVFKAIPWAELHNFYGPSEATIDVTSWHCTPDSVKDVVPIGRPLANARTYIVDDTGSPVPAGEVGELLVGGAGVARGYRFRPELTGERFLPNPFADDPAPRVYRTGDLARYRPDGSIEFLGRTDEQVKIRGFRIEPGEIEFALEQLPSVRQAVVKPVDSVRLEAYVVCYPDAGQPAPGDMLTSLAQRLPAHMLPGNLEILPQFPRMPNGKIDRAALAPSQAKSERSADDGSLSGRLTQLMTEVLNQPVADPRASFFDLGGTSLQAARLVARVRNRFGVDVTLGQFIDAPTPAELARVIEPADPPGEGEDPELQRPRRGETETAASDASALTLVCLPHAGGTPATYSGWAEALAPEVRVVALQPPRPTADHPLTLQESAAALASELRSRSHGPYAFFGSSLGAIIAFEVARVLLGEGNEPPIWLFVCGSSVPHMAATTGRHLRSLPDAEFLAEVRRFGAIPHEVMADAGLQREFLPGLRGDYVLAETYEYSPGPPLPCPISVFRGISDPIVNSGELQLWEEYSGHAVTVRSLPGSPMALP